MEPDAELAKILEEYLTKLREGRSIDICLAEDTETDKQVEPLLYTAQFISSLPKVQASEEFQRTAKGRLMARLYELENHAVKNQVNVKPIYSFSDHFHLVMDQIWHAFGSARKVAIPVTICLILIVSCIMGTSNFTSPSPAMADGCVLDIINGSVEIVAPIIGIQPGTDGMNLYAGTRVRTTQDSTGILTFFDGSTLKLEPGTDIEIQQLESSEKQAVTIVIKQWVGRTWSNVVKMEENGSRYEINTPSAVAVVHGTEFLIDVDETGQTTEQTTEGLVSVIANGEEVFVSAGKITVVELGTSPSEPMLAAALQDEEPQEQTSQGTDNNTSNQNTPLAYGQSNTQNNEQGEKDGNAQGQGNDNAQGQGNGNAQGQDNNNAQDKNNANAQGQGNNNGQGQGNNNGQGQGNSGGQGQGNSGGQGQGNSGGQGQGNSGGQGQGNSGGQGQGNVNSQK